MGFDLYGMKPNVKEPAPELPSFKAEDNQETKDARERYWQWEKNNPGVYFRSNVWFWRPLWYFVTRICDDILTERDVEGGSSNDGHKINKTKSEKIAKRLYSMLDNGEVAEYEKGYKEHLNSLNEKDWDKSYPFDIEHVREFADFCTDSGGFEIC